MQAAYTSTNQLYWNDANPSELILIYPFNPNKQNFWLDGQPAEILIPFHNKEFMIELF